jgi:hypothetical protein
VSQRYTRARQTREARRHQRAMRELS